MHIETRVVPVSVDTEEKPFTYPEINALYLHLFTLKENIGKTLSRRERAEVMIGACILRRFDTRGQIVKALRASGLSPNLVIDALNDRTGDDPWAYLWRRDDSGRYHLHDPA